jgi:hypothetical protein
VGAGSGHWGVAGAEGEIYMAMSVRRIWRLLVVAVVLAGGVVIGAAPAGAFVPSTDFSPIRGVGGKCMDRAGTANGSPVQLLTCSEGLPSQQWRMSGENPIAAIPIVDVGCLDVDGTGNGAHVIVNSCDAGAATQAWSFDFPSSRLINRASGRCLDTTGGSSADHARLQIWDCSGGASQQWKPKFSPPRLVAGGDITSTRSQLIAAVDVNVVHGAGGFTFTTDNVPPGLRLVPTHPENIYSGQFHFEGVPTQVGRFGVALTVTDFLGNTDRATFNWTINPPRVAVPNLLGDTAAQATASLRAAGLAPQAAGNIPTDDQAADGRVATQNPAAGSIVVQGSAVSFVVWHFVPNQCGPLPC